MSAQPEPSDSAVETQVVIRRANGDTRVRRNDDEGVWLKPERIDGDGEIYLSVSALGEALRVLGYNRVDLGFPG